MWTKTSDGSIVDESGKVIFFSTHRFVEDVCLGNCCFLCGAAPDAKKFNDEHVIPDWVLRRYDLHNRTMTLANSQTIRYARWKVPCCQECNALMGLKIEKPISEVVRAGHNTFNDFAASGGLLKIFIWLGLIFLKAHLKDREFRWHRDARVSQERISDFHTWEDLHHVHCLIRCFFNGATVEQAAIGSFLTMPVRSKLSSEQFDFSDLSLGQTLMMRLDDFAVFAVFNDSGGAMNWFWQKLERITGPVNELQAREIMAELAFLNLHLEPRPTFHTETDIRQKTLRIRAWRPPAPEMAKFDHTVRGTLMEKAIGFAIPNIRAQNQTSDQIVAEIRSGRFTLLFNNEGTFLSTDGG